jgi:hypothetical protein
MEKKSFQPTNVGVRAAFAARYHEMRFAVR